MEIYEMKIELEELTNAGDYRYMITSPDLPGLIVVGDTPEEVITLAPQVASALIASIKAAGDPLPPSLQSKPAYPRISHITVSVPV
jgi:predicted RNase H-like HicB family nuclease